MGIYNLLIVEDSVEFANLIVQFFQTHCADCFRVVGVANNGGAGVEAIMKILPDVVIVDLVMPNVDGLTLISAIRAAKIKQPLIVVLSAAFSDTIIARAYDAGADEYFRKPFDFHILKTSIITSLNKRSPTSSALVFERLPQLLAAFGMEQHLDGYTYLKEAIRLCADDIELSQHLTKELYPAIAEVCQSTPARVERSIRHAIAIAWSTGKVQALCGQIFGIIPEKRPSNGKAIRALTEYVKRKRLPMEG